MKWMNNCSDTFIVSLNDKLISLLAISHRSPVNSFGQMHIKCSFDDRRYPWDMHWPPFRHVELSLTRQVGSVRRHRDPYLFNPQTHIERLLTANIPRHDKYNSHVQLYGIVQFIPDHPELHLQKVRLFESLKYSVHVPWIHPSLKQTCAFVLLRGIWTIDAIRCTGKNVNLIGK